MKPLNITSTLIILQVPDAAASAGRTSYIIGAVIALFILGYLIYSLLKPDKF
jgi:K+-transporting ATPase KdpF subunit